MPRPSKPCKYCESLEHWPFQCRENPKFKERLAKRKVAKSYAPRVKPIKKVGKQTAKWYKIRAKWFDQHPADYYTCYLCGLSLMPSDTTLDHVQSRSHRPDLRYDFSNLRPCCLKCNQEKGSKSFDI